MSTDPMAELYQQMILEHNKKPRNFKKLESPTHFAEGFNPLCGDHYTVYLNVDAQGIIQEATFDGAGCAISKASASMMTAAVKNLSIEQARGMFEDFHKLLTGKTEPAIEERLGKLKIFSGIWKYPSRVKCASLSWHALNAAVSSYGEPTTVSTE